MAYRTDQFFRINEAGEYGYYDRTRGPGPDRGLKYTTGGDNGTFMYPDRKIRTADHDGYKTTTLKRGYMRSLRTQADGIDVDVKKCLFQFNPSVLSQSIRQTEGLLNVFQSDPSQYAQPIPGNVSFSFELLFDRTMEVNNPANGISGAFDYLNPWELSDSSEVGVLKDLAALFGVIGQGVSKSQVDYLKIVLERQLDREHNDPSIGGEDDDYDKKKAQIPEFLKMNLGNTAFLLPVPIRIVFSALYIVEGFAQGTSVIFTKFSSQMVPLQAKVTVEVDAKYIGFAKPSTFLTVALDKEIQDFEEQKAQETAFANEIAEAGIRAVPSLTMGIYNTRGTTLRTLYSFLYDNPVDSKNNVVKTQIRTYVPSSYRQDPIVDLFESKDLVSASIEGEINIYGPYNSSAANNPSQEGLEAYVNNHKENEVTRSTKGDGAKNVRASTGSEWLNTAGVVYGPGTIREQPLPPDTRSTSYYIVKYSAEVALTSGALKTVGRGKFYRLVSPDTQYSLKNTITIRWPSYGQNEDGLVVTDTVTRSDLPGTTSDDRLPGSRGVPNS